MKRLLTNMLLVSGLTALAGCATSVVPKDAPSMESIYRKHSGGSDQASLAKRQQVLKMRDHLESAKDHPNYAVSLPAHPERMKHLYPKLPNPELYMYVFPHAVGETGAVIPGYYTRFPMYEQDHYALPGETVDTVRRNDVVDRALAEVEREREKAQRRGRARDKQHNHVNVQEAH